MVGFPLACEKNSGRGCVTEHVRFGLTGAECPLRKGAGLQAQADAGGAVQDGPDGVSSSLSWAGSG